MRLQGGDMQPAVSGTQTLKKTLKFGCYGFEAIDQGWRNQHDGMNVRSRLRMLRIKMELVETELLDW
jgi:hypothetical protein